jgi:replicative DNA helicase
MDRIEHAIAGSVLYDATAVLPILALRGITSAQFTDASPRAVLSAAESITATGKHIDLLTIQDAMQRAGRSAAEVSDIAAACLNESPSLSTIEHTIGLFIEANIRRTAAAEAIEFARDVSSEANPGALIHVHTSRLLGMLKDDAVDKRTNQERIGQAVEVWREIRDGGRKMAGLSTGLEELDRMTGGLQPSRMYIVAGRPSAGKTSLGLHMANAQVEAGARVGWIAMDMGADDLLQRLACHKTGASLSRLNRGTAGGQVEQVESVVPVLGAEPWNFKEDSRCWNRCAAWARMLKAKGGLDILYLDYIQQLSIDGMNFAGKDNSRITHISGAVKLLARELSIPVVAIAQLRRLEDGEESSPHLSDLRDSGSLEQDAYGVFMLYKAAHQPQFGGDEKRTAIYCRIAKQQNGEQGLIPLWFDKPCFRFSHDPKPPPNDQAGIKMWLTHGMIVADEQSNKRKKGWKQ